MAAVTTKPVARTIPAKPVAPAAPVSQFVRGKVKKDGTPWGRKGGMSKIDRRVHIKLLEDKMKMWQGMTPETMVEECVEQEITLPDQVNAEPAKFKGLILRKLVMKHLETLM